MKQHRQRRPAEKSRAGSVRIIGGRWRGRRLPVADLPGLRPSGDRGRETLFNWLQQVIEGARCADLFAGTGALGLEAASRGAGEVVLIENSKPVAAVLRRSIDALGAERVSLVEGDALDWLSRCPPRSLDVVFIDPPFGTGLAERALEALDRNGCLAPAGLVYLERHVAENPPAAAGFLTARERRVGDVLIQLLQKVAAA